MKRILFFILCLFSIPTATTRAAEPALRVACIGNSITYGTGIADRKQDSYPAILQRLLGDGYIVENFGKPGATLLLRGHRPYLKQEEFRRAMNFRGDIAVIHLGINDTDPRDWPNYRDDFVADYLTLIDSLRASNPRIRILIAQLTPLTHEHPRFRSGTRLWHEEIQQAIRTIANVSHVELIDFHTPLYPHPDLFPDAVHPNEQGARILAETVYAGITGNYGGLRMPILYTDNMVLQRGIPLEIHGSADACETVSVRFNGQRRKTKASATGRWSVLLDPMEAAEGLTLEIATPHRHLTYRNVALGEVWLCSGQSNMQFRVEESADRLDTTVFESPSLRFFDMKGRWETGNIAWPQSVTDSVARLKYFAATSWQPSSREQVMRFSAVGYAFARMLQDSLKVPIGIICNAVGGSTTESWIDRHTLECAFPDILTDWLRNDFIQEWARKRAAKNMSLSTARHKRHPYEPCYLFEAGILPLDHYPIRGVIWYQGESNAHNFETHKRLFHLLIGSWRRYWNNESMPFYYVQLSSLSRPSWPWFRESQRQLLTETAYTGMAVSSDRGDSLNVHPKYKADIGYRLCRWALNRNYGFDLVPSGPLFRQAELKGSQVKVTFDYGKGLKSSDGGRIIGFELAGQDCIFYPANASIHKNEIILTAPGINHPRYVRYAWAPFTRANLVNSDNLPASTFRAELASDKADRQAKKIRH